jgi:hypothetical protein
MITQGAVGAFTLYLNSRGARPVTFGSRSDELLVGENGLEYLRIRAVVT